MLYRIQRFGIQQTSKIAAIVYFVIGIVVIPFFYAAMNAPPTPGDPRIDKMNPAVLLLVPFFYALIGWISTAIILYVYNRVAKSFGGVELDIVYAVEPPPDHPASSGAAGLR